MSECTVFDSRDAHHPVAAAKFSILPDGTARFVYGRRYLERDDAFGFDPINLSLMPDEVEIPVHLDGSYGVLSDAGPNTWGMRLTASICKATGKPMPRNPVEWLLNSWHYGAGSLAFSPSPQRLPELPIKPMAMAALDKRLLKAVEEIDTTRDYEALQIMLPGASLGGVRPKTVAMHEGAEYILKFNHIDDVFDVAAAEYASLRMAHMAGISTPDFELMQIAGRSVLAVSRFDRGEGERRMHYISAKSLLNLDSQVIDRNALIAKFSYAGIAEVSRKIDPKAVEDSRQLFRRMVFNIMIGNVDDHMRNHGFLMTDEPGRYRLTPVFDVVPHLQGAFHPQAIGVGDDGPASTIRNALSQCGRFHLNVEEAAQIVIELKDVCSRWRDIFKEADISDRDRRTLEECFRVADEAETISVPAATMHWRARRGEQLVDMALAAIGHAFGTEVERRVATSVDGIRFEFDAVAKTGEGVTSQWTIIEVRYLRSARSFQQFMQTVARMENMARRYLKANGASGGLHLVLMVESVETLRAREMDALRRAVERSNVLVSFQVLSVEDAASH